MDLAKRRIRLDLCFNGRAFEGWQSQPHGKTVQDTLEKALREMTQEELRVIGCSRTDSGVHALHYVAHFNTRSQIPTPGFTAGLNSLLPESIAVLETADVPGEFHARESVREKTYRYEILNRRVRDPLCFDRVWQIFDPLNFEAMARAAQDLQGEHDFSCFRAADDVKPNAVRTLSTCRLSQKSAPFGGTEIHVEVRARGFMKYMVRNIVGTLVEVGRGRRTSESMPALLASKDRTKAGATAPAAGLYLVKVDY